MIYLLAKSIKSICGNDFTQHNTPLHKPRRILILILILILDNRIYLQIMITDNR